MWLVTGCVRPVPLGSECEPGSDQCVLSAEAGVLPILCMGLEVPAEAGADPHYLDLDGDQYCEGADNCQGLPNPDQLDHDGDGRGDACDEDDDGDGVPDLSDACPLLFEKSELDACGCTLDPPPMLAYFPLDEGGGTSVGDVLGHAPPGLLVHSDETSWTSGYAGSALSFDGTDDAVQFGAAATGVRALAFWMKPASTSHLYQHTPWLSPSSIGPYDDWLEPEKAFDAGGGAAYTGSIIGIVRQHWGGFHIQIPEGADVLGVTVAVRSASLGLLSGLGIELSFDGGTTHTSASYGAIALVGTFADTRGFGGADKRWGFPVTANALSDMNFRVRANFNVVVGGMNIDHLQVQVHHTDALMPRNILRLGGAAQLEFGPGGASNLTLTGWPSAQIFVNGAAENTVTDDWNHIVITSAEPLDLSELELAQVAGEDPLLGFAGELDDLRLFQAPLGAGDAEVLFRNHGCGLPVQ